MASVPYTAPALGSLSLRRLTGAQVILVLLVVVGVLFVPHFTTSDNLVRIIQSQAFIGVVAIGMTFVVLSGGFADLSVPAVIAISANSLLLLLPHSIALGLAVGLGCPLAIGAFNGVMIGRVKLNPVICTLGVGAVAHGILLAATGGRSVTGKVEGFNHLGNLQPLGIPIATWAFVALLVVAHLAITRTRFGFYVRMVGANARAAANGGARPAQIVGICFLVSAACAALTGLLLASFSNVALNSTGTGYEFDALTAIVIGGNSLTGAKGSMGRTLVGVLVMGVATNMMLLSGMSTQVQFCLRGALFVAAVAIDATVARRSGGRS
jgi:ribose/xylose/arabinose/galactoside ABC-type transport system permease subunit